MSLQDNSNLKKACKEKRKNKKKKTKSVTSDTDKNLSDNDYDETVKKEGKNKKNFKKKKDKEKDSNGIKPSRILTSSDHEVGRCSISFDQRDEQRLFVKFLSLNTTEQDLKQCHANISNVHFLTIKNIKPNSKKSAFVEFIDAKALQDSLEAFKLNLMNAHPAAVVDYVGAKSSHHKGSKLKMYTSLKLFVTGFEPLKTTHEEIKSLFPKCTKIEWDFSDEAEKVIRKSSCVISFDSEDECKKASSLKLTTKNGNKLLIQFALANKRQVKKSLKKLK